MTDISNNETDETPDGSVDDNEQIEKLKPQVYEYIEVHAPVSHDELMRTFGGQCECCGKHNEKGTRIAKARARLLDENRILTDLNWNYRVKEGQADD